MITLILIDLIPVIIIQQFPPSSCVFQQEWREISQVNQVSQVFTSVPVDRKVGKIGSQAERALRHQFGVLTLILELVDKVIFTIHKSLKSCKLEFMWILFIQNKTGRVCITTYCEVGLYTIYFSTKFILWTFIIVLMSFREQWFEQEKICVLFYLQRQVYPRYIDSVWRQNFWTDTNWRYQHFGCSWEGRKKEFFWNNNDNELL